MFALTLAIVALGTYTGLHVVAALRRASAAQYRTVTLRPARMVRP
jgi:hypothetical protein